MSETISNLLFLFSVRPKFPQNNKRSKWKIPPQTPPFPFATSEFKKESAEVLANPFLPKKQFCQNFVRIVPPPARDLEGRAPKKNILSFFKKIYTSATPEKQGTFFFGVAERSDAVAERFIQHQDFDGKKFGFCSGDTAKRG